MDHGSQQRSQCLLQGRLFGDRLIGVIAAVAGDGSTASFTSTVSLSFGFPTVASLRGYRRPDDVRSRSGWLRRRRISNGIRHRSQGWVRAWVLVFRSWQAWRWLPAEFATPCENFEAPF